MAAKRKAITKKTRFEIFKRDLFKCQYCGATPPDAVLNVDHVEPVSKGGSNDIDNLITACFSCNIGKSNNDLNQSPNTLIEKAEILKEREEQLRQYKRLMKNKKARMARDVNELEQIFQDAFNYVFLAKTKLYIKNVFMSRLDIETLKENLEKACLKIPDDPGDAYTYFCGICWNQIKGKGRQYG